MTNDQGLEQQLEDFRADFLALEEEVSKVVVGEEQTIALALTALVTGGHVLLEGLPGMGKTLLVRTLASALDLSFYRVQCTPDLMPTDLIGTYVITETPQGRRTFEFQKGPLFANMVLADQINRTPPKTQAALLEAMEEGAVSVSTETFRLPRPWLVVATQNPLEMEGTFPLPEAQLDRFFFKLLVRAPSCAQMEQILQRTTEPEQPKARKIVDGPRMIEMSELARHIPIADPIRRWAISVAAATHPENDRAPEAVRRLVRYGASPRGAQAMVLGAKVRAVLSGRAYVSCADLRAVAHAALRHRLILNFEGQAENVAPDQLIDGILQAIPEPGA